ncbi:MAG: biopolymer transporter ExbD [Methylomonas sp.]|jgi:biopolymer transport protein ExbD
MDFRRKKRVPVDIGLIPMIDVLLVLLFFFMLATTFRQHTDLKINLPQAEGAESDQTSKSINLYIDAKGVYGIGDEKDNVKNVDLAGLKAALKALAETSRQLPFIIYADGQAQHQFVISAMDVANDAGFHHITFAISPPDKK